MQNIKEWIYIILFMIFLIIGIGIAGNNDMQVYCMQHPGTCEQVNE